MFSGDIESFKAIIKTVVDGEALELVDIEMKGRGKATVLQIYVDKEGGVTVDDCAKVSHQAEMALEAENFMDNVAYLEVSSPGLTRPLKKPDDYKKAVGSLACLVLRDTAADVEPRKTLGVIKDADEERITFELKDTGKKIEIPYSAVKKANLEIEF